MSAVALTLVLISALIHSIWNLLAKRAGGGTLFVWLFTSVSSLVLVPGTGMYLWWKQPSITLQGWAFVVGTSVIHLVYFWLLQRAYGSGDLSLVYPLARGIGPAVATVGAIVMLDERPSALALLGLALVVAGVVLLTVQRRDPPFRHPRAAVIYGSLTGLCIALYTVWDKYTVSVLQVPPLVIEAGAGLGIWIMLTPRVRTRWPQVTELWRRSRLEVFGVAALAPLSYILVLWAMALAPLSYVAPAREISILFAAILGTQLLNEGRTVQRLLAASSMVCGVVALAFG